MGPASAPEGGAAVSEDIKGSPMARSTARSPSRTNRHAELPGSIIAARACYCSCGVRAGYAFRFFVIDRDVLTVKDGA